MVSVSAMAIVFLIAILALIGQRQLLPGIVMLGSFILFVLWLTGLIETSIQLYGPSGSVNTYCSIYRPVGGTAQETMGWLANNGICEFYSIPIFAEPKRYGC
jgi:ABC-type multidrug transport system fused ATPase/permease subunit